MNNDEKNGLVKYFLSSRRDNQIKHFFEILNVDPVNWPPPFRMNQTFLKQKYHELVQILEEHCIYVEFAEKLPLSEAYRYLTETFLYDKDYALNEGWFCVITGCNGDCPGCFQRDYCDFVLEIWSQEELVKEMIQRCRQRAT